MSYRSLLSKVDYNKIVHTVKDDVTSEELEILMLHLMVTLAYRDIAKEYKQLDSYMTEVSLDRNMLFLYVILCLDALKLKSVDKERLIRNILIAVLTFLSMNNIRKIDSVDSLFKLLPEWKLRELMVQYLHYCI